MSLKGTQLVSPDAPGLQPAFSPVACKSASAKGTQGVNGPPANEGLIPDGRKKLTSAEGTKNGSFAPGIGFAPQLAMARGLVEGEAPAATAACQFAASRSPRAALALIGRFRWCPPLKM